GDMLASGRNGVPTDYTEALKWFIRIAETGDVCMMVQLAEWYQRDDFLVTTKNYGEALKWYRRAAEAGDTRTMWTLGLLHQHGGCGLAKNLTEAIRWYRRAFAAYPDYATNFASI